MATAIKANSSVVRVKYQPIDEANINWSDLFSNVIDVKYAEHGVCIFSDTQLDDTDK